MITDNPISNAQYVVDDIAELTAPVLAIFPTGVIFNVKNDKSYFLDSGVLKPVRGTDFKTINGNPILGVGDLPISGSAEIKQTEVDFGSVPVRMKRFTITDAGVGPTNRIAATLSYDDPSDGEEDSAEWFEDMRIMARAGTGQFFLYVSSLFVDMNGKVKINYIIGS